MAGYNKKIRESIKRYKGEEHPVDKIAYKLRAYNLADQHGVKHAEVIRLYSSILSIYWDILPEQFIIKPQHGCSTKGVLPLVRNKQGKYKDILRRRVMSKKQIIDYYMEGTLPEAKEKHSRELWIEELLSNPLPFDWKVFAFNGKVIMIRQYKRGNKNDYCKFWTPDWKPIKNIYTKLFHYKEDQKLPAPEHKQEIIEAAEKLSLGIKYPFARIDLYDLPEGVFIGEITPHPGTDIIYTPYWDTLLGTLWEKAEKELGYE